MIFSNLDRLVFAGDSVTDMDRARPLGEGLFNNLGFGYPRMVENLLAACYPETHVRITNAGVSGDTSRDLLARWQTDVVALKPDYISIMIGINDVWRQFDTPAMPDYAVLPDEYRENLDKMLASATETATGVFLMTPYYMEPLRADPMRARMDEYGAICRDLAAKYGAEFIDLQALFDEYFKHRHSAFIAWDRIHPNQIGATLIAREFLRHCGFEFDR